MYEMQRVNHVFLKIRKYLEGLSSAIYQFIDTDVSTFKLNEGSQEFFSLLFLKLCLHYIFSDMKYMLHNTIKAYSEIKNISYINVHAYT